MEFKENNFIDFCIKTINFFVRRFFNIQIVKKGSFKERLISKRIFGNKKIIYNNEGYYRVSPMPNKNDLDKYYATLYWKTRDDKTSNVSIRDIYHFQLIKHYFPELFSNNKVFLNMGAGHGGMSYLCWLSGMKVINIEPGGLPNHFTERWFIYSSLEDVDTKKIDLVYGSHSLEHVHDISYYKEHIKRVLKKNGKVFMEVPNAKNPTNGAQLNRVDVPHTYYFEKEFFINWFHNTTFCDAYDDNYKYLNLDADSNKNDYGKVVRVLGDFS